MYPTGITSQQFCDHFNIGGSYKNAARNARRFVQRYNLPYTYIGHKWYTTGGQQ